MSDQLSKLRAIYQQPLMDLLYQAQTVHREHNNPNEVQRCALLSIKTGACPEDCGYCSQSGRFNTDTKAEKLMSVESVLDEARRAKANGAQRFCMGAAWRGVRDGEQFDRVLAMVKGVRDLGMEACVTLGMLSEQQAQRLRDAGLTAYNHNLDTSREHYPNVVSTHTFDDRLATIRRVQKANISVCCGGILGMNETEDDRLKLLAELLAFEPAPESIPINSLMPMKNTPLEGARPVEPIQLVRLIATTRIFFPKARVRLSAGRERMTDELQALCFFAGANSIFFGDRLLTAANPSVSEDGALFSSLGMQTTAQPT